MKGHLIKNGDNPDITKERKSATFCINKMAEFIYEGSDKVKRREEILKYVEEHPELCDKIPVEFMTREERVERNAQKAVAMTDHADCIDGSDFFGEGMYYQTLVMGRDFHGMLLHYSMFLQCIQSQCTEEQLDKWLPLTILRGIIGTYAQTELGHGTNLKKLETTATYDAKTEEFILNSPTITAAKWWPGGLGKTCNYAIIMAQLYTNGQNKGPHPFIVQLRDLDNHMPLPNITIGDIGPKLGVNGADNGFLLFKNCRIPRENMLMRYAKILPNGEYIAPKHSKLGYGAMVFTRSIMIRDQALMLSAATVIATRYSAVRRQGEIIENKGEIQIIDYQTQQYRIFPQIARAFAFLLAASEIRDMYLNYMEKSQMTSDISLLGDLHALSCGLKAIVTFETAQGIEQCRFACGGHGYSEASGLPQLYTFAVGGCTYEGENIVMLLQVAKILMKLVKNINDGTDNLASITKYIKKKSDLKSNFKDYRTTSGEEIIKDFENIARNQILTCYENFTNNLKQSTYEEAVNKTGIEMCKATRLHVKLYLVKNFYKKVTLIEDYEIRNVVMNLWKLYAFDMLSHLTGALKCNNYMNDIQIKNIKEGIYYYLNEIRPNAVAIVDSFNMSDRELHSVLGRRDGNVYENLLKWAKESQLNKKEVLPTFKKYFEGMMKDGRSKI
ncbi:Peroxisomal acyl-coenzyme A oxidase 2 [Strongyloides ratti]|uniref:Acyl-coenzyme A oxidase n=1 Tax=Strongyloides ratti TaxID=34506 RepID=A0A090L1H7_STRRB|nr:Peroxisomal acyl-coenzyme A oxidase 2 [Strongyloides ratti]CEF61972.1 Peroxisomal acyl-coenzyme A oxidase 2 [Strongyloides ratti]